MRPSRLWSAQADWRVHCEGYAQAFAAESGAQSPAAVVRIADEYRVRVADSSVQPHAELVAEQRRGGNAAEVREVRRHQRRSGDSPLLVALPVAEEENPVPPDGAADGEPELPALEERVRIGGIAVERGIGGELVVAKEIEGGAVEIVASGAGDDVDRSGR